MGKKKPVTVGVIGLGHWGPNVVRNFADNSRVNLKYVCDLSEETYGRVKKFLDEDCRFTNDASDIIDDGEIDAVAVVTPATTHYDIVKKALQAGKHVFCEKPLSLEVKECEDLCDIAQGKNLKLMVGNTFLYNNGVRKLKELYDGGDLGDIYYMVSTRTHLGLIRKDVNAIWDLATHDVAIMNYLMGESPVRVSAVGTTPLGLENMDVGFLTLYYSKGIIGNIHVSWVNSNKERVVCIIGSRARAVFDDLNNLEPVKIFNKGIGFTDRVEPEFGDFRFLLRDGDIISPKIDMWEPLKFMVNEFVEVVADNKKTVSDGRFSVEITKTIVAAQESAKLGGAALDIN